jgi:hypothetical protein
MPIFLQGTSHINNMVISDKYVPKFIMNQNVNVMFLGKFIGKVEKQKKFNHLYTIRVFGGVTKN